jgi:hypothetical protein
MERYKNLEEFISEFGSPRVNQKTENLCDTSEPYTIGEPHNENY